MALDPGACGIVESSDKPTDTAKAHTLEDNARMLAGLNLAVATGQVFC